MNKRKMAFGMGAVLTGLFPGALLAQTVEPADIYSTNLAENMYYSRYNPNNQTLEGVHFLVLADGNNSKHVTPGFEVSIYIAPADDIRPETVRILKTYRLEGLYHMGSLEFRNETIDLGPASNYRVGKTYRVGVWVNSNEAFEEKRENNAYLFEDPFIFQTGGGRKSSAPTAVPAPSDTDADADMDADDTAEDDSDSDED
ncbi:hypothetical protein GC167_08485 [bacterium]|nr:hypothetical protein [bacterium]